MPASNYHSVRSTTRVAWCELGACAVAGGLTCTRRVVCSRARAVCQAIQVQYDSPAARAGVQPGDLLLEIDGKAIGSVTDIHRILPRPGTTVMLKLLRTGPGGAAASPIMLPLTTEERPDPGRVQRALPG